MTSIILVVAYRIKLTQKFLQFRSNQRYVSKEINEVIQLQFIENKKVDLMNILTYKNFPK